MEKKLKGKDSGYIFSGPLMEEKTKTVKEGVILVDNHRTGVVISDNPESPWYQAAVYSHGSILRDPKGNLARFLGEVRIILWIDVYLVSIVIYMPCSE